MTASTRRTPGLAMPHSVATLTLVLLGWQQAALAQDGFDPSTGRLRAEDAAWSFGFECDEPGTCPWLVIQRGDEAPDPSEWFVALDDPLEGRGALRLGGEVPVGFVFFDMIHESLLGRRVEVRLWYHAEGTDVRGILQWERGGPQFGVLAMSPTGRATSDGWVELTSGPFDWQVAGASPPPVLLLLDGVFEYEQLFDEPAPRHPQATALVDGLTVWDIGPAAVAAAPCTILDEADVCDPGGVCAFGRCVDGAVVYGGMPYTPEQRVAVLERARFAMHTFAGARNRTDALDGVDALVDRAEDADPASWAIEIAEAWETLIDGHASPPVVGAAPLNAPPLPVCFVPGVADMLPDAPEVPIVVPGDAGRLGLQTGDALVAIDGAPPAEWVEAADRLIYYAGDPSNLAGVAPLYLSLQLAGVGAELTFARCPHADGEACTDEEVETVTVDLADELFPYVSGGDVPEWARSPTSGRCDLRFTPLPVPVGTARRPNEPVGTIEHEGSPVLQVSGFPKTDEWYETVGAAIENAGEGGLIIDQRFGQGGYVEAVEFMSQRAMAEGQTLVAWILPDLPLTDARLAELDACTSTDLVRDQLLGCANSIRMVQQDPSTGTGTDAPIALVSGWDVSGNDYFSVAMARRDAPTYHIGSGPTFGAFGHVCRSAPLYESISLWSYQCADTVFLESSDAPTVGDLVWATGVGVAPDEIVLQRQSDAVRGIDTLLQVAHDWLGAQ